MDPAWTALALSLKVAGWATALNLVLGVAVGLLLARGRFPGRDLLDTMLTLPMVMPPTVLGYYLLVLIGRNGPLGAWLRETFGINLIFTWQGAVIAATIVSFPLVFKPARAAFEAVDGQLEQAARVLGASPLRAWREVTFPIIARAPLVSAVFSFTISLGEFGATSFLARPEMPTLPVAIYRFLSQPDGLNYGQAMAMATLLMLLTTLAILAIEKLRLSDSGEF